MSFLNTLVLGSALTVTDCDYSGLHQLLDQIQGIASPVLQFSLKRNDIEEHFTTLESLIKERTKEVELKERSVMKRNMELEKKEEEVIERERKQCLLSSLLKRLDCETANEAANVLEERVKEVERISKCNDDKSRELDKDAEMVKESLKQLETREKKLSLIDEAIKEMMSALKKKEKTFDAEQIVKAERMELKCKEKMATLEKKEMMFEVKQKAKAEEMDVREKKLEEREKELSLRDEAIKEKVIELKKKEMIFEAEERELKSKEKMAALEKKEKIFGAEQKAKAEEMNVKEKKLDEREKELDLKQKKLEQVMDKLKERELQEQAGSLIPPAKRHKTHNHDDAASASQQQRDKACKVEEEPEKIKIPDSEFHDFRKTMSSFLVDKIWALYDPRDDMPRLYAKIKRITKYKSTLDVTWLDHKDEESVPVACGRFTYGRTETVNHLTFSHEVKPIIHGRNISVNPKEGETWAVFRDWSPSWENNHKPPYRYDFVEVVEVFEDHQGVGVTYLGKVEGFVSVFKHPVQNGVYKKVIGPNEMQRFSHRVPSVRLNGEEREGVPAGSFELDPAAVPRYILRGKKKEVQAGSAEDNPLIILD
ncbi:unnamed protein product [Eruca vesicaria subsp. sativa]|uniref:DUF3444 domain-containing protein n=1 Tax=Eruca vesicaria subsp. sativa TaxID=29727 RepID=A0ABC8IY17_ERUVS|nr:unnamed protein product [Eruca vesicaria subsp. sativa]